MSKLESLLYIITATGDFVSRGVWRLESTGARDARLFRLASSR